MTSTHHTLAEWLRARMVARGYDLGARGGGRTRLAEDTGVPRVAITRILSGTPTSDIGNLRALADHFGSPLADVLVLAGIITARELEAVRPEPEPEPVADQLPVEPLTPEAAADELGITDPHQRAAFISMLAAFRRDTPAPAPAPDARTDHHAPDEPHPHPDQQQ